MTKTEAIKVLKSKMDGSVDTSYEWTEAVRMAIDALEQNTVSEETYTREYNLRKKAEWEAYILERKLAEQESKWIPVTERLPILNDDGVSDTVLLCWSDGQRTVGAYRGDRTFVGQAWPEAKDVRVTVTAWQPLPEPYRESEE